MTKSKKESEKITVEIEIFNWEKHNPRKDVKNCSWFRVDHDIFTTKEFFELSPAQLGTYLFLLGAASKSNSGIFRLQLSFIRRVGRIKKSLLESTLKILQQNQILNFKYVTDTLRTRNENDTHTCLTNERTEQNERTNTRAYVDASQNVEDKLKFNGEKNEFIEPKTDEEKSLFMKDLISRCNLNN